MATPSDTTVARLGTGTMGPGIAHSLARAGFPLRAWNRSHERAEPLASVWATVAGDPAEAVRGADVVLTVVWDANALADVIAEAGPCGTVWLQTSTIGVEGARRLAALADDHGLVFVDSPVPGTKLPAEQGQFVVLAAGPDTVRTTADPVFDAIGHHTLWLGKKPGTASARAGVPSGSPARRG